MLNSQINKLMLFAIISCTVTQTPVKALTNQDAVKLFGLGLGLCGLYNMCKENNRPLSGSLLIGTGLFLVTKNEAIVRRANSTGGFSGWFSEGMQTLSNKIDNLSPEPIALWSRTCHAWNQLIGKAPVR
jgi:hypothetical protein